MRSKKERESDTFKFWKKLGLYSLNNLDVQKPPEPDFIYKDSNIFIGIEHTSLVHEIDNNGVDIVMHNVLAKQITEQAWKAFKNKNDVLLHVTISFKCTHGFATPGEPIYLAGNDREELTKYLSSFVENNYPREAEESVNFDWRNKLHRKLDGISIWNTSHFGGECWTEITGGIVPMLAMDHLQARINAKNEKPIRYKLDYDQTWLLMVENEAKHHTYFDIENSEFQEHSYDTVFDRLFIYRLRNNSIIELNK